MFEKSIIKKIVGYILVAVCGIFFASVVVQEYLAVIEQMEQTATSIEFVHVANGTYNKSVIMFTAYDFKDSADDHGGSFSFGQFCQCAMMFYNNRQDGLIPRKIYFVFSLFSPYPQIKFFHRQKLCTFFV